MNTLFEKHLKIDPKIAKLNFTRLKYKLQRNDQGESWTNEQCESAEREYKRFLTLVKLNPKKEIVPTKLMDKFWHQHILDTMAYQKDCQTVFGYFLHHFPYFGIYGEKDQQNLNDSFEITKKLYYEYFGEEIEQPEASRCQDHACHVPSNCACRVSGACKSFQ
jgi:hypothetical protein